jgi:hypothetical protein
MSTKKTDPASDSLRGVLADLVGEARATPTPEPDWDKVDEALFARVDHAAAQTRSEKRAFASHKGQPWPWLLLGGVAAAAAAALVMAHPVTQTSLSPDVAMLEGSAGELAFQTGGGEVRVDGAKARAGVRARQGESIETHGAKAVFESTGRVSWLMEDESKAQVERSGGVASGESSPVVLALAHGAIEAQVTPVATGEAFAIDVAGVRVAVHGTHLRVARDGNRVVVDLTEGVVSIGNPPKVGSTYGTLVTAPAHVEFQADAVSTSLVIEHDRDAIRGAVDITSPVTEDTSVVLPTAVALSANHGDEPGATHPARTTSRAQPAVMARNPKAEAVIQNAVAACWAKYPAAAPQHSSDSTAATTTTITFATPPTVKFDIKDDGFPADVAVFTPPLQDTVQGCARQAVLRTTRFLEAESGRSRTINLDLQR